MIASVIIFLLMAILIVIVVGAVIGYSFMSWGAVTYFFVNWFLVSTLNQNFGMDVTNITYVQAIGLYLVLTIINSGTNTKLNKINKQTQNEYKQSIDLKLTKDKINKLKRKPTNHSDFTVFDRDTQIKELEEELKELKEGRMSTWAVIISPWLTLFIGWVFYSWFY